MAVFRIEKNNNYTTMSNYHFRDKNLSWKAKGILSNMLSLPDNWDYSLAGLATLSSDGMTATRSAIKELEEHGYLIRKSIRQNGKIIDWEYIIYECPIKKEEENQESENQQSGKSDVEKPVVENPQVDNHTQLNTKESNTNKSITKERKKERKTSYDDILSRIEDESLRELYYEYIKMRTMIKKPMTDRALTMLINRVIELEPNSIDRQKKMLETAIMNNWKSVYPIKDDAQNKYQQTNNQDKWAKSTEYTEDELPY